MCFWYFETSAILPIRVCHFKNYDLLVCGLLFTFIRLAFFNDALVSFILLYMVMILFWFAYCKCFWAFYSFFFAIISWLIEVEMLFAFYDMFSLVVNYFLHENVCLWIWNNLCTSHIPFLVWACLGFWKSLGSRQRQGLVMCYQRYISNWDVFWYFLCVHSLRTSI